MSLNQDTADRNILARTAADRKIALYFGSKNDDGHYLHEPCGGTVHPARIRGFPWTFALIDAGLLKNGRHADVVDGKVFWTCGGRSGLTDVWFAFFWWDRSGDGRGNSNSGLYVRGFAFEHVREAFEYAKYIWADIIERQKCPLVLQGVDEAVERARAISLAQKSVDVQQTKLAQGWLPIRAAPELIQMQAAAYPPKLGELICKCFMDGEGRPYIVKFSSTGKAAELFFAIPHWLPSTPRNNARNESLTPPPGAE